MGENKGFLFLQSSFFSLDATLWLCVSYHWWGKTTEFKRI